MKIILIYLLLTISLTIHAESQFIQNLDSGIKQTVVVYGTSLTAMGVWPKMLETKLKSQYSKNLTLINSGMSGRDSNAGLENLDKKVLKFKPDTVFLEFGMNDAVKRFHNTPDLVKKNLEEIIRRLKLQNPKCEIILMTMNPCLGIDPNHRSARTNLNQYYDIYRDLARDHNFKLIDHYENWTSFLKHQKDHTKFIPDGVHPNKLGQQSVFFPFLLEQLGIH